MIARVGGTNLFRADLTTWAPRCGDEARAVGTVHQALLSGVLLQWLIDPDRADLVGGLRLIAEDVLTR